MQYRSDMTVNLVDCMASDAAVVRAARVSSGTESDGDRDTGLINFLMRDRHGSPFEHNAFTFYIEAPIFVFREFMRHRIASYNEESARYKELESVFYVPNEDRNLIQTGKVGAYEFVPGTHDQYLDVHYAIKETTKVAYAAYKDQLKAGIAREVARMVLPVNIYSSMYVTLNARSLMNFLSLRTKSDESAYPSFPQREIELVAEQMEAYFAAKMPVTWSKFCANGRVAP